MIYSVSNWVYDLGDEPLAVTFERLKRYGYDGVELKGEPDRYDPAQVRHLCDEFGLRVLSICGWCIAPTDSRDLAHPDPRIHKNSIEYFNQLVDFAVSVGAPIVIFVPAPAGRRAPIGEISTFELWQAAYKREWANAVEGIKQVAAHAEERSITLVIEPLSRYEGFIVRNADEAIRFVRDVNSPAVKVHFDTFQMDIDERDLAGAARRAGSLLASIHIADSSRGPVGSGHTDFRAFVHALKDIGFSGPLTMEPVPPHPDVGIATTAAEYRPLRDLYAEQNIRLLREYEQEALPERV